MGKKVMCEPENCIKNFIWTSNQINFLLNSPLCRGVVLESDNTLCHIHPEDGGSRFLRNVG